MILWIIISVVFGPPALLLLLGVLFSIKLIPERVFDRLMRPIHDLHQPPQWVRYIMGTSFSRSKMVLWIWLAGPAMVLLLVLHRIWFLMCSIRGHRFDKTYGTDREGNPDYYCSSCYRWKSGRGFCS